MNQNAMRGLDLSGLPPEVRAKIEKRFAAMSPEARAKWASGGAPLLARLASTLAAAGNSGSAPPPVPGTKQASGTQHNHPTRYQPSEPINPERMEPHGHYNETVRPGDAPGSSAWILIVGLALGLLALLLF